MSDEYSLDGKYKRDNLIDEHHRYERALEAIRDRCGAVCPEYEVCTHPWCAASYTAWALADEALRSEAAGTLAAEPPHNPEERTDG